MTPRLCMWTIYDHPDDLPDKFVARRWEIHGAMPFATDEIRSSDSLEHLRYQFAREGLLCLPRDRSDDPVVVETWL